MKKYYSLIFVSLLLVFTGCLDNDFEDPNTEFILSVSLGDEEDRFEVDGDEIRIMSIRYFVDNVRVFAVNEDEEFVSNPVYVNLNTAGFSFESFVGAGELFGGSYTGVGFDLTLPPLDANIDDELLLERNELGEVVDRNTLAITGMYNNIGFTIVSDSTPELEYSFDRNINMPEKNGTLQVTLLAEWETWFMDENMESIIDPTDTSNHQQIIDNFERFFTAQTVTAGEL